MKRISILFFAVIGFFLFASLILYGDLKARYAEVVSVLVFDRNNEALSLAKNGFGYYADPIKEIPENFAMPLIKNEDRFFYYHPGVNPGSIFRDLVSYVRTGERNGSSTLTQQLVKILLRNEGERTIGNKITEMLYSFSLELWTRKQTILTMYANTAYFGNQEQGISSASRYYFDKPPAALTDIEITALLATLNSPSVRYPGTEKNHQAISLVAAAAGIPLAETDFEDLTGTFAPRAKSHNTPTFFEIEDVDISCEWSCVLTIDGALTETLREILHEHLLSPAFQGVDHGAIVVIKLPENELLSIIGSPNPYAFAPGSRINMAMKPRPIGSTAKPFFYLKAFEKGARPYSLVEDREYKYDIGTGFEFYPKNYDGRYRGFVTLHEALANSLNVPSVKALEFVGLGDFSSFLTDTLGFVPIQPLETYGLGIALGGLEMDLLTLSHYFTIFPNGGVLKPLTVFAETSDVSSVLTPPMEQTSRGVITAASAPEVALVNKILSDRSVGVEQFGIKSFLNISAENYALKTGTSRDYHDSWTIGYTPDFLVGVWVGNSDNTPMPHVSGQSGAGRIWHDAMEVLLNSPYHKGNTFDFSALETFHTAGSSFEYGLPEDDYERARNILLENDHSLITHPHDGDTLLFEKDMAIPLKARESVEWRVNGEYFGNGREVLWIPRKPDTYIVSATADSLMDTVRITISND